MNSIVTITDEHYLKEIEIFLEEIKEIDKNTDYADFNKFLVESHEIEKALGQYKKEYVFIGQIGTGKSTLINALLPNITLSDEEQKKIKNATNSIDLEISYLSLLPTGNGNTTVCPIEIELNPLYRIAEIDVQCYDLKENQQYIKEYLESLFDKDKRPIPKEFQRYFNNLFIDEWLVEEFGEELNKDRVTAKNRHLFKELLLREYSEFELQKIFFRKLEDVNDANKNKSWIVNEKIINSKSSKFLEKFKHESYENKELRVVKHLIKKINAGEYQILLPKKIFLKLKNSLNGEHYIFKDSKGLENSSKDKDGILFSTNTEIDNYLMDCNTNIILASKFQEAPSVDIEYICNNQSYKEKILTKGALFLLPSKPLLEDEIWEKEDRALERISTLEDFIFTINSFTHGLKAPRNEKERFFKSLGKNKKSVFSILNDIDKKRKENLLLELKEIRDKIKGYLDFIKAKLTQSEFNLIEESLDNLASHIKEEIIDVELAKYSVSLHVEELIRSTHACIVNASMARKGKYHSLDLNANIKNQNNSLIKKIKFEIFNKIKDVLKDVEIDKDKKQNLKSVLKSFLDSKSEDILVLVGNVHESFKNDDSFWELVQGEWGKGIGYRARVIDHFKENKDFTNIDASIEDFYVYFEFIESFKNLIEEFTLKEKDI